MEFSPTRASFRVLRLGGGMCRTHAATYLDRLAKTFAARPGNASFGGVYIGNKLVPVAILRTRNAAAPNFVHSTDSQLRHKPRKWDQCNQR